MDDPSFQEMARACGIDDDEFEFEPHGDSGVHFMTQNIHVGLQTQNWMEGHDASVVDGVFETSQAGGSLMSLQQSLGSNRISKVDYHFMVET